MGQVIPFPGKYHPRPKPPTTMRQAEHFYYCILQASGELPDEAQRRAAELSRATLAQNFGEGEI